MRVVPVPCLSDNYAYLIVAPGGALVVDPSEEAPVTAALEREGLRPAAILCTHHHWDHVGGVEGLRARFASLGDLPVYGHEIDAERGRIPAQTDRVTDGEARTIGGARVQVLHIPGHTLGAVAYHLPDAGAVFTGDTLFGAGCGRLFEGTPELMHRSLSHLAALPGETQVYCGHEYTLRNLEFAAAVEPDSAAIREQRAAVQAARAAGLPSVPSTLTEELATNPFLRCGEAQVRRRAHAEEPDLPTGAAPAEVLGAIRRWKDRF